MKHTLNTINGVFARMLASGQQRRRTTAYCAALALTAGAFGLTDGVPTVGGSASAQPGCYWDGGTTTLTCPSISSLPEFPPSFDCEFPCGSGYGEHWGPPLVARLPRLAPARPVPRVIPITVPERRARACEVFTASRDLGERMDMGFPMGRVYDTVRFALRTFGAYGMRATCR